MVLVGAEEIDENVNDEETVSEDLKVDQRLGRLVSKSDSIRHIRSCIEQKDSQDHVPVRLEPRVWVKDIAFSTVHQQA